MLAAIGIGYAAVVRLLNPRLLDDVGVGLIVSVVASVLNLATARILLRVGRSQRSISLEADANHLLTDVWTSAGVILGIGLVWLTGWLWLDPAIAILVAVNISRTGWQLMRRSVDGLMDAALPLETLNIIEGVLDSYRAEGVDFMRYARVKLGNMHLRPFMCWCQVTGQYRKGMTIWSVSNLTCKLQCLICR